MFSPTKLISEDMVMRQRLLAVPPLAAHPAHQGQLQVIFGPMFSGKTTELIRRCKRYQLANYRCIVVKYAKDTRYADNEVATHDRDTLPALPAVDLTSIRKTLLDFEVVAIDEGQFFSDIVPVCEELANKGKMVIVAALDGDFKRQAFGSILELVPLAESVVKLNAVCMMCFRNASYTKRTSADTAVEVIGGADKYIATCRECHQAEGGVVKQPLQLIEHEQQQQPTTNAFRTMQQNVHHLITANSRSPRKQEVMG